MIKQLFLLRHAHSVDRQPGLTDHERYLSPSGIRECSVIGNELKEKKVKPDLLIASSAARANATAHLVAQLMGFDKPIVLMDDLYEASTRTFLQVLNSLDDQSTSVLCVGHNPVITYLAEYLTKEAIGDFPTCAVASIRFACTSWKEVSEGMGSIDFFIYPQLLQ